MPDNRALEDWLSEIEATCRQLARLHDMPEHVHALRALLSAVRRARACDLTNLVL